MPPRNGSHRERLRPAAAHAAARWPVRSRAATRPRLPAAGCARDDTPQTSLLTGQAVDVDNDHCADLAQPSSRCCGGDPIRAETEASQTGPLTNPPTRPLSRNAAFNGHHPCGVARRRNLWFRRPAPMRVARRLTCHPSSGRRSRAPVLGNPWRGGERGGVGVTPARRGERRRDANAPGSAGGISLSWMASADLGMPLSRGTQSY